MNIHRTCPSFDAATHRMSDTFTDTPDPDNGRIIRHYDAEPIPPEEALAERIAAVKAEAGRRILSIAPEWMQRNLTARAVELALLYPGTKGVDLPEPERSEYLAGQAVWERIRAIRAASNQIETTLAAESDNGAVVAELPALVWPS